MDLLRRYFPSVLQNYGSTGSKAEYKTLSADGDAADETESHASSWDDGSESNDSDGSGESDSDGEESDVDEEETYRVPGHDEMASTTSVAFPGIKTGVTPASLYLNLEIQSFIENVRQLEASSDAEMDFSSMASSMHSEMAATDGLKNGKTALSSFAPSRDSTSSPDLSARPRNGDVLGGSSSKSSRTLACVAQAQKLYAEATNYMSEDAAEPFINTIESVTALLAYTDMASSPLKCWLDTKRRFTLAETVNSAILGEWCRRRAMSFSICEASHSCAAPMFSPIKSGSTILPIEAGDDRTAGQCRCLDLQIQRVRRIPAVEGGQGGYRDGFACQCEYHYTISNCVASFAHLNQFGQLRWSPPSSLLTFEPFCLNDKRLTHIYGFLYVLHYGGRIAGVTVCIDVVIVIVHVSICSSMSTRLHPCTMSYIQQLSTPVSKKGKPLNYRRPHR
jgi:hypothetical protein